MRVRVKVDVSRLVKHYAKYHSNTNHQKLKEVLTAQIGQQNVWKRKSNNGETILESDDDEFIFYSPHPDAYKNIDENDIKQLIIDEYEKLLRSAKFSILYDEFTIPNIDIRQFHKRLETLKKGT